MSNFVGSAKGIANRVGALTGLRIFAALAIVLFHLQGVLWISAGAFHGIPLNQGVSFFYVLSGFILQHSYRNRIGSDGGVSPAQFIALRFCRLWPCHIAVILLIIFANGNWILNYYQNTFNTSQILAAIFLFQAWHPDLKVVFGLNGPAWSISVELFFYIMFPLLNRQALKSPFRAMYLGAAITISWLMAVWLYMPGGDLTALTGTIPLVRIFEFSVGVSTYEYFLQPHRRFRSGTLLEFGAIALMLISVTSTRLVSGFIGEGFGALIVWWLGGSGSFLVFAILIGIFFCQEGKVSRVISWKPIVYLGEISFALYLVHQPVISFLVNFAPWFHQFPVFMQVMLFTIIVLALSSALHHLIEKPCMQIAKRLILNRETHVGMWVTYKVNNLKAYFDRK